MWRKKTPWRAKKELHPVLLGQLTRKTEDLLWNSGRKKKNKVQGGPASIMVPDEEQPGHDQKFGHRQKPIWRIRTKAYSMELHTSSSGEESLGDGAEGGLMGAA